MKSLHSVCHLCAPRVASKHHLNIGRPQLHDESVRGDPGVLPRTYDRAPSATPRVGIA